MIRYALSKGARIMFVGINPHPGSDRRGVPFSNNKMFWYLLSRAGLIEEDEGHLKDDSRLSALYHKRLAQEYGINLINIVDRPTRDVSMLEDGEERKGVARLRAAVRKYSPRVLCFVGKVTYQRFSGMKEVEYGWASQVEGVRAFVMHFPLRGEARIRVAELREVMAASCRGRGSGRQLRRRPPANGGAPVSPVLPSI